MLGEGIRRSTPPPLSLSRRAGKVDARRGDWFLVGIAHQERGSSREHMVKGKEGGHAIPRSFSIRKGEADNTLFKDVVSESIFATRIQTFLAGASCIREKKKKNSRTRERALFCVSVFRGGVNRPGKTPPL